jgi:hypothetical protein
VTQVKAVIRARGHRHITGTHAKTFELTPSAEITARATCVIGVGAEVDWTALASLAGPVEITVDAAGVSQTVLAEASPFWNQGESLVVRRSDFRGGDTLAIGADAGAADLDRALLQALQDPSLEVTVTVRQVGNRPDTVVATDRREHTAVAAIPTTAIVPTPALMAAAEDRDDLLARPGIPAIAAALALLGADDGIVVHGPLPHGATARKAHLAAAFRQAKAVVTYEPAAVDTGRPFAIAVDNGEAVIEVRRNHLPARLPQGARFVAAIQGDGAAADGDETDHRDLLQALLAQGVSVRTLRDAIATVPRLAQAWDYDALNRLR